MNGRSCCEPPIALVAANGNDWSQAAVADTTYNRTFRPHRALTVTGPSFITVAAHIKASEQIGPSALSRKFIRFPSEGLNRGLARKLGMVTTKPPTVLDELPALTRYARSLTHDRDQAEDLVHDALVSALANAGRYERDRPLRVWLFSILHNVFVSGTRRQLVQNRHRSLAAVEETQMAEPAQETSLRLRQLERALGSLSEDQRAALHLVAVEELSYQDAAAALGIPIGTLISRISRARARLRDLENGTQERGEPAKLRVVGKSND